MGKNKYLAFSVLFVIFAFVGINVGQTTTSTIEGTVTDNNGAVIAGATVTAKGSTLSVERNVTTDSNGFYRFVALPAGSYSLTVNQNGFASKTSSLELTLNKTAVFNVQLQVAGKVERVDVLGEGELLETNEATVGLTVTPKQIADLPVNGRNYLDLLQLVPGVAVNRQADPKGDESTPILGERAGNNNFFIDGHPNKDTVSGGAAAQFNQDTIAEFQVLTTGYKAEFGQASGAIVNVITKSGNNEFHGTGSFFLRNDKLDSSNSLDPTVTEPRPLKRYNYSIAGGGPVIKNKFFFFASSERITENRRLDFTFPDLQNATVNQLIHKQEDPFDTPALTYETRNFIKLNQQLGRHSLSQEFNYTNGRVKNYLPLSASDTLPSGRNDFSNRHLLLAFSDTVLFGDQGSPYILTLRGAYRGEPSDIKPSHPEVGGYTLLNLYTAASTGFIFGDLPQVQYGNTYSASKMNQEYVSVNGILNKQWGRNDVKLGWNYLRTRADGVEGQIQQDQLFSYANDFASLGSLNSGIHLLLNIGGLTPADNEIHLKNDYNAMFMQDDWKIVNNLTVNLGVRLEKDSEFRSRNIAPRLGFAWSPTDKTVIRGNLGVFYDQFRLGLVRNIKAFGGTDHRLVQSFLFPRLLYGSPSWVSSYAFLVGLPGACFSNGLVGNLTDAQITNAGMTCPLAPGVPFVGVDRLNKVVAAGRSPIPANTVVTASNVQSLTGLTPDQFAAQAGIAVGVPGLFRFGPFGFLTQDVFPPQARPVTVDNSFKTPNTLGFSIGFQREITKEMAVEGDFFLRKMRNLLGVRTTNLAFQSRVTGNATYLAPNTGLAINTFGPFFEGEYKSLVLSLNRRLSKRYSFGMNYTYAKATDNSLGISTPPTDNFVGIVPVVTETSTGKTNANGSFTAANGNFVAKAGTFLNGPDLDKGNSDLSVDHIFQVNGLVQLPWQIQLSGIFRAQSGFHYSRAATGLVDPDGNGNTNGRDITVARNAFTAPPFVNMDLRVSKQIKFNERVKALVLFEMFNLFNRQNPAAVEATTTVTSRPFGTITQVLPGREGQFGFRLEF